MQDLVIFRTAPADLLPLRQDQDKCIAANCKTKLGKLAAEDPFADIDLFSGQSKEGVPEALVELINLHKHYGMELKSPSHNLGPGYDYLGVSEESNSNALGRT